MQHVGGRRRAIINGTDLGTMAGHQFFIGDMNVVHRPSRRLGRQGIAAENVGRVIEQLMQAGVPFGQVGSFINEQRLTVRKPDEGELLDIDLDTLRDAWLKPLDW